MFAKVFVIVAIVAACDAALIPLSTNWPTQTACSRSGGSGLSYLSNSGNLDYNQLFQVLYPELALDPLEDIGLNVYTSLPQVGNGFEINDLYKSIATGVTGSSRMILPSRELTGGSFRRSYSVNNCEEPRNVAEFRGDPRGFCDCRRCVQSIGNCEGGEYGEGRCICECGGCNEGRCTNECRGCCECRNCCRLGNGCECNNFCDSGAFYECNKPFPACSSRSGCNCRCESFGLDCRGNLPCCPCRSIKRQGQCGCCPMCY